MGICLRYAFVLLVLCNLCAGCGGGDDCPICPPIPPGPTLTSVAPSSGLVTGGEPVTLTGSGFAARRAGTTIVRFGGMDATDVTVVDNTTLTCLTPAHPEGAVRVEVKNDNGWDEIEDGFLYRPLPVSFEEEAGGTAAWSSEQERIPGVQAIRFETPDAAAGAKALLPYDGTLGAITTFGLWVRSNTDNYAPFIRMELDSDGDPSTVEVVVRCEPVLTTGWGSLPADTWTQFDVLQMACEAWEVDALGNVTNHVDCPWDAPTLADFISGDAMAMGNFCADPSPWSTMAYGPLNVIEIAIQSGEGGPWAGVVGYADSIQLNDRLFHSDD